MNLGRAIIHVDAAMCLCISPSMLHGLLRLPSVREVYYLERHRERHLRRYGVPEVLVQGELGEFTGMRFTPWSPARTASASRLHGNIGAGP